MIVCITALFFCFTDDTKFLKISEKLLLMY